MTLYAACVPSMAKMLKNLLVWLDETESYAKERSFDPETLLVARLAPDQFPLIRQVQSACDSAKLAAYRLAGKEAPAHPDEEKTLAEIRLRVKSVIELVESLKEADFESAEDRIITLPFLPPGKAVRGEDYFNEFALPNFYFHATTAYAILRHNGVPLGKRSFIGSVTLQDV